MPHSMCSLGNIPSLASSIYLLPLCQQLPTDRPHNPCHQSMPQEINFKLCLYMSNSSFKTISLSGHYSRVFILQMDQKGDSLSPSHILQQKSVTKTPLYPSELHKQHFLNKVWVKSYPETGKTFHQVLNRHHSALIISIENHFG